MDIVENYSENENNINNNKLEVMSNNNFYLTVPLKDKMITERKELVLSTLLQISEVVYDTLDGMLNIIYLTIRCVIHFVKPKKNLRGYNNHAF
jgi:hypothetical protein